jgi:transposase-like protein
MENDPSASLRTVSERHPGGYTTGQRASSLTKRAQPRQAREYGIKDSVLSRWKQEFIERSPMLFEQSPVNDDRDQPQF